MHCSNRGTFVKYEKYKIMLSELASTAGQSRGGAGVRSWNTVSGVQRCRLCGLFACIQLTPLLASKRWGRLVNGEETSEAPAVGNADTSSSCSVGR